MQDNILVSNFTSRPTLAVISFVLFVHCLLNSHIEIPTSMSFSGPKIDLSQYHLSAPIIRIKKINNNASGLTFNPDKKTLFLIVNNPEKIVELDLKGNVLRQISLKGFLDTEGIIYLGNENFAIAEERDRTLSIIKILNSTKSVSHDGAISIRIQHRKSNNKGFEGLTYDFDKKEFYIANEKRPRKIIAIPDPRLSIMDPIFKNMSEIDKGLNNLNDYAGLHHDKKTGNLLVLSEESKVVIEMNLNGQVISKLNLTSNEPGARYRIPQPEGITMDDKGTLYICSEPNLLYIFEKSNNTELPEFMFEDFKITSL